MKLKNLSKTFIGILKWNLFKKKSPLNVVLSVTDKCNLDCIYCNCNYRKSKELSRTQILDLIDQMSLAGVQRVGIFGGEPLIRNDIGEIIDYMHNKGMFVSMVTNGILVQKKIKDLKNLNLLIVSLDGPEEMHDKNRGQGSFAKAIEAIKIARKCLPVWTIATITKNNIEGVDFIARLARAMGFGVTFQFLYHNECLGRNRIDLLPSREECIKVIKKILLYKRQGYPIVSSACYLERSLKWPDFSKNVSKHSFDNLRCIAGKLYCSIDTEGTVYPCSVLIGNGKGRNFLESGFSRAFYSLEAPECTACISSCMIEQSYMFSLNIRFIAEHTANMIGLGILSRRKKCLKSQR